LLTLLLVGYGAVRVFSENGMTLIGLNDPHGEEFWFYDWLQRRKMSWRQEGRRRSEGNFASQSF
jgi:hypothetical protein